MKDNIYRLVQGYECLSACLGYYMSAYYPEITGSDICIYGGALSVSYNRDTHIISTPIYEANYIFLKESGISYVHDCLCKGYIEGFVTSCIRAEKKLIIKVCTGQLTYNRVFKQAEHSTHFVTIVGETINEYHVVDCYVPTRRPSIFDGLVDKKEVISAWQGKNYEYIILEDMELEYDNVCEKVKKSIIESLQLYLKSEISSEEMTGEKAVRTLFNYLGEKVKDPDLQKIMLDINYQLKIYGFISSKAMLVQTLKKYANCYFICKQYEEVIASWNNICVLLVKLGITKKWEQYEKIQEKVIQTLDRERKLVLEILEKLLYH